MRGKTLLWMVGGAVAVVLVAAILFPIFAKTKEGRRKPNLRAQVEWNQRAALLEKANHLRDAGKFAEAEAALDEYTERAGNDSDVALQRAYLYDDAGQTQRAIDQYASFLVPRDPGNASLWKNWTLWKRYAELLERKGLTEQAIRAYQEATIRTQALPSYRPTAVTLERAKYDAMLAEKTRYGHGETWAAAHPGPPTWELVR